MRLLLDAAWPCLLIPLLAVALQLPVASSSCATAGRTEWQVLTRANFSQIRLHPHVLLVVTMPWYGESRSLMAEIKHLVAADEQDLGRLKLIVVYRNSEKFLTDAIGVTEGIKFIYYQHSIPFKYQGKLRARDILSSVHYIMSLTHEEAPFVVLHTKEEVETFIESTDKAILLSEFCGWFTRLAHGGSNRSYEDISSKIHTENVDISGKTLTRESDGPLELIDIDESGVAATFPANRPSAILFIDRLSDSAKVRDESKLSLKLLREYVQKNYPSHVSTGGLSNSRMRSKVVRSVMRTGISDAHSETARLNAWAAKFMELGEKMSVMVVNDGESISYRSASQGGTNNPLYDILTKLLHKTRPAHRSKKTRISFVAKDAGLKLLSDDSKVQVMESLSIQESQHESTDDSFANSDSVNDDIAEVSVHENKATEAEYIDDGQAPSILEKTPADYCDINNNDLESSDAEMVEEHKTEASDVSPDLQEEVSIDVHSSNEVGGVLHKHKDEKIVTEALDVLEPDGRIVQSNQEKSGSPSQRDDEFSVLGQESRRIEDDIYEDNVFNLDEGSEESDSKYYPHATFSSSSSLVSDNTDHTEQVTSSISDDHFGGSFFFSDGGYRLLRALTGGSRIPSLVIIDPVRQKHYVFPEESEFSYPLLANYFDSFVNQSLSSYYHSASSVLNSKELPRPPFVNHDFHEANSIPQLTTSSFCPLVLGFECCDSKNEMTFLNAENIPSAWKKDVLVLFSNSWCGVCQRTELVVHEVYRSFKSFMSSNSQFANPQDLQIEEKNEESTMKGFPAIYLMDCTSNECYHLLKSAGKEELYPTLLLFPAENKSAISYEGGMSVANLIEFLESHVSNSRHLLEYKGFLWKKRTVMQHDAPQAIQFHISDKSSSSVGYHSPSLSERNKAHIVTGSTLTATEKFGAAVPFDNALVLIVSADSHEGFHGLIINKRLSWDVFKNLDSSMEPIKHAPLFYGGPVVVQGYHLVSMSRVALEGYAQVIPGLYYGNIIATSRVVTRIKSGEQSAEDLWFFLGYSGWGYSQLFEELSEGAWHVSGKPIEHLDWPES